MLPRAYAHQFCTPGLLKQADHDVQRTPSVNEALRGDGFLWLLCKRRVCQCASRFAFAGFSPVVSRNVAVNEELPVRGWLLPLRRMIFTVPGCYSRI